ncbi:GTPase family protein [Roseivivax sediminis]|uniref:G domain-containing protein n=1 Tax=Roseivivax sediminis TaxID=936889 RepID=A0A1I1X960_9RHOB|nr:GTPase domain-containing protein [Roseivivax sediminis]SFE03955.1 hypothetical protein SAMN04515678_105292 [Roseivivax sediminis]
MIVDRLRGALLRWRIVLRAAAIGLPFLAGFLLGLVWLREHGALLQFSIGCALFALAIYVALNSPAWFAKRDEAPDPEDIEGGHVEANPDWSAPERAAFAAGRALIDARLSSRPMPAEEMQAFALEVIRTVARASGDRGKGEFDFTIPEALLLVERVSSRLRANLKSHISISDRISVGTLLWLWRNQDRARRIYGLGYGAYRVFRATAGLPLAIIRELNDVVTSGNSEMLTGELHVIGQRILYEEIAKAATELYSGRLRMSDAELLDSILADANLDRARLAEPDAPLRIAIAGQISAGKSSLANALLGREAAETDMPPTTDRETAHDGEILGMPCHVVDLPGLDGSTGVKEVTLREAERCDILLWALPVNRPGREVDRAAIDAIFARFSERPDRRVPPVLGVATFCDRLAGPDWPYPEHAIPQEVQTRIGEAVRAIAQEVGIEAPVPVSVGADDWNVPAVRQQLEARFFEAVSVQRNRARLARGEKSFGREAVDTVHGVTRSLRAVGKQAAARYRGSTRR